MSGGGRILENSKTATSGAEKKNADAPGGGRRGFTMLNIQQSSGADNMATAYRMNSPEKNASLWLEGQIAVARDGVFSQTIELTPAIARVLLSRNPGNRKISPLTVENYARDMANGAWSFNGEPIIVSSDGLLNDGQHRCEAVLSSNVSIPVILVIGTERSTRLTLDQGKMRMAGDYLGMNGHADSVALASAAKYAWQHKNLGILSGLSNHSPTKGEVLHFVETTPTLVESLRAIQSKDSGSVGGRSILAFLHWTFMRVSGRKVDADAFMASLMKGANLGVRSPILYARTRLMSERGRLKPNEKAELIIRAWNATRRGDKVASLPIKGGALPLVER